MEDRDMPPDVLEMLVNALGLGQNIEFGQRVARIVRSIIARRENITNEQFDAWVGSGYVEQTATFLHLTDMVTDMFDTIAEMVEQQVIRENAKSN